MDPVITLPCEIFTNIISFLSPLDICKCSLLSTMWNEASNSNYVWDLMCDQLWYDKVYVPAEYKAFRQDGHPKRAYFLSLRDSSRQHIRGEELSQFVWNFRFKEAAGDHWLANDPWWKDKSPARVHFHSDGHIQIENDWPVAVNDETGRVLERRWKFIKSAAGKQGPTGSFLQINNFPPCIYVLITLYKNWGFLLQSCWVFYTSFPMPRPGAALDLEDAALDVTTETMKQEAMRYNIGVEFNLQDHAQILDLLHLIAHINHPTAFDVDLNDIDTDNDENDDNDNEDNEDDENEDNEDEDDNEDDNEDEDEELEDIDEDEEDGEEEEDEGDDGDDGDNGIDLTQSSDMVD